MNEVVDELRVAAQGLALLGCGEGRGRGAGRGQTKEAWVAGQKEEKGVADEYRPNTNAHQPPIELRCSKRKVAAT